jgi:hypothetical protein
MADDRLWAQLQGEAAKKFARATELSPEKDRVQAEWGRVLERLALASGQAVPALAPPPRPGALGPAAPPAAGPPSPRRQKSLEAALAHYQLAWDLGGKYDAAESLARVAALLAFGAAGQAEFESLFLKAATLGRQAVRASDSPAGAWLAWARSLLAFREAGLPPARLGLAVAEIFAAFNHCLRSGPESVPRLVEMADGAWSLAAQFPEAQDQALSLLIEICRRLARLDPAEPGYGFALGLSLYAQLASRPAWPDDPAVTGDLSAKMAFQEALAAFLESLESLSLWRPRAASPAPAGQAQAFGPLRFLAPEVGQAWVYAPGATFQERLASALNRPVGRLLAMARPEGLPPWYQFQLASFLRLAAAAGYLPPEEQMAYWRLALRYLRLARGREAGGQDLGLIMAEEGLVLAELNLLNPAPDPALLKEAETLWAAAEKVAPGSSHYARARWASWRGDEEGLRKSLAHPPAWEDSLVWPSFQRAMADPAFKAYRGESWLKAAWHGYSR